MHRGENHPVVLELRQLLGAVGFTLERESTLFDDALSSLVEAFQRSRGLVITGDVDEVTWARLEEARWRLGGRLLYFSTPHLRGDDVAELQMQLAQLGFNTGRVDGIFGVETRRALSDFQENCGLRATGELDRYTLIELERLRARAPRPPVTEVHDVVATGTRSGPRLVGGSGPLAEALAGDGQWVAETGLTPAELAARANELDAALVVHCRPEARSGLALHYWASYRSHSRRGEELASRLAAHLATGETGLRVDIAGMALPVLRETRMATLDIAHGPLDGDARRAVVDALNQVVATLYTREGPAPTR